MEDMLTKLLSSIVKQAESLFNDFLISTMDTAFFSEKSMQSYIGGNVIDFNTVYNVIFSFGISLIILKFLKKGIETYLLWQNGEATNSVGGLLLRFVEAMIFAIGFPFIYKIGIDVAKDFGNSVLSALSVDTSANSLITTLITLITSSGLFTAILVIILLILIVILYIQLLKRGIEILVLRLGVPIACVGLLDSNNGVFSPYVKKFFQNVITVVVQVFLIKLVLLLILGGNLFFAIACCLLALSPKFLQEFALASPGGEIGKGINLISSIRRIIK